jgi:excisionase family DNA binding protein
MSAEPKTTQLRTWESLRDVLTTQQVAEFLQISVSTVKRMCVTGEIPAEKIKAGWRVEKENLRYVLLPKEKKLALVDFVFFSEPYSADIRAAAGLIQSFSQDHEALTARLITAAEKLEAFSNPK